MVPIFLLVLLEIVSSFQPLEIRGTSRPLIQKAIANSNDCQSHLAGPCLGVERNGHRQRYTRTRGRCNLSTARNSSPSTGRILFERILRSNSAANEIDFLGSVISWLQDFWNLPSNIPMVYEKRAHEYKGEQDGHDLGVLSLHSALSPCSLATTLHVDVVAIRPESSNSGTMLALVVVYKKAGAADAFCDLPPMVQSLFCDAEKIVIRDLDQALMDWQMSEKPLEYRATKNFETAKRTMLDEITSSSGKADTQSAEKNSSDFEDVDQMGEKAKFQPSLSLLSSSQQERAEANKSSRHSTPSKSSNSDFAVQAAKTIAQQQIKKRALVKEAKKYTEEKDGNADISDLNVRQNSSKMCKGQNPSINLGEWELPSLSDKALASRYFAKTISRPQDFCTRKEKRQNKHRAPMPGKPRVQNSSFGDSPPSKHMRKSSPISSKEKSESHISTDGAVSASKETTYRNEEIRQHLASDALDDAINASKDLSAEELLDAVMSFGDNKRKEEVLGNGFVTGAFEKAKELLQSDKRKNEEGLERHRTTKVEEDAPNTHPGIEFSEKKMKGQQISGDILRAMFEAGGKLADKEIATVNRIGSGALSEQKEIDEQMVNELVAGNKEVSSYARVLDDELAELEMRMTKSPGEEFDSDNENGVFDIFSGPELFNPNVDPENVVNWPGGIPGTKTIGHLPEQLKEAVRQAKFAVSALSKLEQREKDGSQSYWIGNRQLSHNEIIQMQLFVSEASNIGLIYDPSDITLQRSRLRLIIDELRHQPKERFPQIVSEYKDLLLSEHFVGLIKERMHELAIQEVESIQKNNSTLYEKQRREIEILGNLVASAQLLLKETQALGAELEAQQLEVIRSICKVAMNPSLQTEEEIASALSDAVRDMRPLFDDTFVAYLKYAIAEEEASLARAGFLDDPDHAQWLYVLKIIQQGVYHEISRGLSRYIDHIGYILRMQTPIERRLLLSEIIDALPAMDVRPFVQTVENIAGALGDAARGEFGDSIVLGEMTNKILQLYRDVRDLLPPERIDQLSRDADEWAKQKREKLSNQKIATTAHLKAADKAGFLEDDTVSLLRGGEMERHD